MAYKIDDSKFYMWRTLFALAHADNIVTDEEKLFMLDILNDIDFSACQLSVLKDDIINGKDIEHMFQGIESHKDRMNFFVFARKLVWVDGNFCNMEQSIMTKLFESSFKETSIDDLVGTVNLEFEDDNMKYVDNEEQTKKTIFDILYSFKSNFINSIRKS